MKFPSFENSSSNSISRRWVALPNLPKLPKMKKKVITNSFLIIENESDRTRETVFGNVYGNATLVYQQQHYGNNNVKISNHYRHHCSSSLSRKTSCESTLSSHRRPSSESESSSLSSTHHYKQQQQQQPQPIQCRSRSQSRRPSQSSSQPCARTQSIDRNTNTRYKALPTPQIQIHHPIMGCSNDIGSAGQCIHHPYMQLRRFSTRTHAWKTLLDSCPLCDDAMENESLPARSRNDVRSRSKSKSKVYPPLPPRQHLQQRRSRSVSQRRRRSSSSSSRS